jgi:hypothetical protein
VFQRSRPRFRSALTSAAVIALLVLSTGSVAAATPAPGGDATFSQNGKGADASSVGCVSNGDGTSTCSDVGISAFVGKMSDNVSGVTHANQVCVSLDLYTLDDATKTLVGDPVSEAGCKADLPNGTIVFGSKLTAVTLATTTISIQQMVCVDKLTCEPGPSRDVAVAGTWTGVGSISSSKYRSVSDDGTCRYDEAANGYSRQASFSGTLDGQSLSLDYASITDGKSTYRSRCSEV